MPFDAGAVYGKMLFDVNRWDKSVKKIQGDTSRMKKKFSEFASSMKKHWLAATAALAGTFLAIRKGWQLMELGAQAKQIEESFDRMASAVGINSKKMRKSLEEASGWTINFSNIAASTSALLAQGLNMDTVIQLMRQARVEARLFGKSTEETYQIIGSAITGGLVTTLRRAYGLQLSLKDAMEDYSKTTGKTVKEVQKYYQAQAIANHILDKAQDHLKAVNEEIKTEYENVQELKARWLSFRESMGKILWKTVFAINVGLDMLRFSFAKIIRWAVETWTSTFELAVKVAEGIEIIGSKLPYAGKMFKDFAKGSRDMLRGLYLEIETWRNLERQYWDKAAEGYKGLFSKVEDSSQKMTKSITDDNKKVITSAEILWKNYVATIEDEVEPAMLRFKDFFVRTFGFTLEEFNRRNDEVMNKSKEKTNESLFMIEERAKRTFNEMSNSFKTFFLDVIHRDLKTAQDYFKSFGDVLLNIAAEIFSQIASMAIAGWTARALPKAWALTSALATIAGPFAPKQAGGKISYTGLYRLHKGEEVKPWHEAGKEREIVIPIYNMISTGLIAQAIMEEPNAVINIMNEDLLRSGTSRKIIKRTF